MIPRASFGRFEGHLLSALLWLTSGLFIVIMLIAWVASERASPVLLDLQTGKPVQQKPAL